MKIVTETWRRRGRVIAALGLVAACIGLAAVIGFLMTCCASAPAAGDGTAESTVESALPSESPLVLGDVLDPQTWVDHFQRDLIPFWTTPVALGSPVGNFPTVRGFDGRLLAAYDYRLPRMLGRQIYFYCAAFMVTGEPKLLEYAQAGVDWLIGHAWDQTHGGWYPRLKADGTPLPGPMYTQDMAYAAMGLAAFYFVTRDPRSEEYLLKTRDLIFNANKFWDAKNQRVKDGLDASLTSELDQEGGGWELVALLDQVNAWMIGVQPLLSKPADRERWARDLQALGGTIVKDFWRDGIFWGQKDLVGQGGRHVDFGHTFKSYWMIWLIDQNLGASLGKTIGNGLETYVPSLLQLAYDPKHGLWGMAPRSPTEAQFGSSWWIYAESNQLAESWNLNTKGSLTPMLRKTLDGWLRYFVDRKYGEVIPEIQPNGRPAWHWTPDDPSKVGDWKNGFHSAENALMAYIHAQALAGGPVTLYFAAAQPQGFATKPYLFPGRETGRELGETFPLGERSLTKLRASLVVELR